MSNEYSESTSFIYKEILSQLNSLNDSVGYNRFYDIIERYGLKVRKRKRRVKTTDSTHEYPVYPNLIKT
ncbi:MAG TPA: hypothetical protein H9984_09965, partial [Candidatus Parabacteroides faecavium]|nr:hypothetical protein [Candidatus Parabacteroides faecavium]